MKVNFFNLSSEEQLALIKKAGDEFDMPDTIIEKDIWICWLLDKIFSLPVKMSFKGGTSLSKVFGLIKRFSEDCDVTIDYRNFKEELNLAAMSRAQLKKTSDNLKEQLKIYVLSTVLPFLQQELLKHFPEKKFEIILNENGEQLNFYYPSVVAIFNSSYANYDDCLVGKFRLIPDDSYLKDLHEDFKKMINSGMFHETPKTFSNIVDELRQLERLINELVIDHSK